MIKRLGLAAAAAACFPTSIHLKLHSSQQRRSRQCGASRGCGPGSVEEDERLVEEAFEFRL